MKDVEQREAGKQKPLSHIAEELGDNCPLFSTPSLSLPPRRNRQRTCHDRLLEKGFDITVSRAVMESRVVHILLGASLILAVGNGSAERSAVGRVWWVATSPCRGRGLYEEFSQPLVHRFTVMGWRIRPCFQQIPHLRFSFFQKWLLTFKEKPYGI